MASAVYAIIANVWCMGFDHACGKEGVENATQGGKGWTCDISIGRCFAYVLTEHSIVPISIFHMASIVCSPRHLQPLKTVATTLFSSTTNEKFIRMKNVT